MIQQEFDIEIFSTESIAPYFVGYEPVTGDGRQNETQSLASWIVKPNISAEYILPLMKDPDEQDVIIATLLFS